MRRASILAVAVVVLGIAAQSSGNLLPANSNTVVQDGIEYYIETDNAVYDLGEDVALRFRMTNVTDEEWELRWLGPGADIVVEAKGEDFREVWFAYQGGDTGPRRLILESGESAEMIASWPQVDFRGTPTLDDDIPAIPGTYRVTGSFVPTDVSVSVDVAIVPEPATILTLVFGIYGLRHLNRKRAES